jgi:hypothetical protein
MTETFKRNNVPLGAGIRYGTGLIYIHIPIDDKVQRADCILRMNDHGISRCKLSVPNRSDNSNLKCTVRLQEKTPSEIEKSTTESYPGGIWPFD